MSFESKTIQLFNDLKTELENYLICYKKITFKKSMTYQEYNEFLLNIENKKEVLNNLLKKFKKRLKIMDLTSWL